LGFGAVWLFWKAAGFGASSIRGGRVGVVFLLGLFGDLLDLALSIFS
jgi:hypothetical protein